VGAEQLAHLAHSFAWRCCCIDTLGDSAGDTPRDSARSGDGAATGKGKEVAAAAATSLALVPLSFSRVRCFLVERVARCFYRPREWASLDAVEVHHGVHNALAVDALI